MPIFPSWDNDDADRQGFTLRPVQQEPDQREHDCDARKRVRRGEGRLLPQRHRVQRVLRPARRKLGVSGLEGRRQHL